MTVDVIDQLLALTQASPLLAVRHARDKVVAATQSSYEGYFAPQLSQFSLKQRLEIAALCSELTPSPVLAAHYVKAAGQAPKANGVGQPAMLAARDFARVLTVKPLDGDALLLLGLTKVGLDTPSVVALAQLVAFVSFQTRLLEGLRAMGEANALIPAHSTNALAFTSTVSGAGLPLGSPISIGGFTNASLEWKSWLEVVDTTAATPEQLEVLKESHPKAMTSDYYRVLVHQAQLLKQRSIAFNAIMYAPGGLSRADRELGATVVSRVNGCVYCASVHAQRFEQLGKRNDAIIQVFENPLAVTSSARDKAIADFSVQLTLHPNQVNANHIQSLSVVGLNMGEILDLIHSVAIFAWANRLMLNLGEPVQVAPS
jgi:uncharacterized peroxidase-related enzyme